MYAFRRLLPFLRPYRSREDMLTWHSDPAVQTYVEERLTRGVYKGIGEFHLAMADQAEAPVVKRCAELAAQRQIFLHAHVDDITVGKLLQLYPQVKLLWAHAGMSASAATVSGLLDRFPNLDIVLPHSGGCFPYIAGRIEHSIHRGVSDIELKRPFRDYIRRFHYDTLAYYPETLRFMIELVGADRVVIGSDNYAKMEVDQPNALVEAIALPPDDLTRILRGNAARLFGLTTGAATS